MKELQEFNDNLRALRDAVHEANVQALEVKEALSDVVNHSHLRSSLTLLKEDIGLRRLLNLQVK